MITNCSFVNFCRQTGSPSREEISKRIADVAGHADEDGPFTAQVFDHDGGQKHGGQNDGSVDDAQRDNAHPFLGVQTAMWYTV